MTAPSPTVPDSLPLPARLPLAARLPLLGLYPAAYRAAHGEEIAAVFTEAVQDLAGRAALREWAALAAHALRLRTRLRSSDPAGRITAGAAPLLLAGGAGLNMAQLLVAYSSPLFEYIAVRHPIQAALILAQFGAWVLALLCASVGRWTPARLLVLLGMVGQIGVALALTHQLQLVSGYFLPSGLVSGTLLLLAPPDAVDLSPRGRRETVLTSLALAVGMVFLPYLWLPTDPSDDFTAPRPALRDIRDAFTTWPATVLSLALLHRLRTHRPDRLHAAGPALAALPWAAMFFPPGYYSLPRPNPDDILRNVGIVLALLTTATLLAALHHFLRRSRPTDPPATT